MLIIQTVVLKINFKVYTHKNVQVLQVTTTSAQVQKYSQNNGCIRFFVNFEF